MIDEGVIKFNCEWIDKSIQIDHFEELNATRNKLYDHKLLGVYSDGIGYGNLSIRIGSSKEFIISGTQTTKIEKLDSKGYVKITNYNIQKNFIRCEGLVKASSESLTHAMIYELDSKVRAVIHVHHKEMWSNLMNQVPTTGEKIPYGTPEMAGEVKRLYQKTTLKIKKIVVMAGHEEGIITFGKDLAEASQVLFQYFNRQS